jgi:hypothetical protein
MSNVKIRPRAALVHRKGFLRGPSCGVDLEEHFDNAYYGCWPDERLSWREKYALAVAEVEAEIAAMPPMLLVFGMSPEAVANRKRLGIPG